MKSRHLSIAAVLLAAVMLVLSLSACTTGEYVPTGTTTGATQEPTGPVTVDIKDLFPALNSDVRGERDTVYLLLANNKNDIVLNAGYLAQKNADGSFHVMYSYDTLNAIAPGVTDYKTTRTGEFVTKDGKIISHNGDDCVVTLEQTARAAFTFSPDNAENVRFGIDHMSNTPLVSADIPDADAFFGLETGYSDLSVSVTYAVSGNAVSIEEMYFECMTDDGWMVAGTYIFDSARIGGNGEG